MYLVVTTMQHLIPRNREQITIACLLAVLYATSLGTSGGASYSPSRQEGWQTYCYRVDVNRAASIELQTLPGIGEKLAAAIIAYREERGPIQDMDELLNVRGIGQKRLDAIRPYLLDARNKTNAPHHAP